MEIIKTHTGKIYVDKEQEQVYNNISKQGQVSKRFLRD